MLESQILRFSDPFPYQTAIRTAQGEILVTAKGDFRAELTEIELPRLWLERRCEVLPRIFHAALNPERATIGFLAGARQASVHHCGRVVSPGDIIFHGSSSAFHRRTSAPCHWAAISLTPEALSTMAIAITGRDLTVPSVTKVVRPTASSMSRLLDLHETVEILAKTTPDILARPEVARALEQALIRAMIDSLTSAMPSEMGRSVHHHSRVIALFEELLAANCDRPLYVAEICAATGVSERTLRVCCHDFLGMGPIQYLRLRRMHLAHHALTLADSRSTTVTEVATQYGFWELGRFSVEYRALFGQSPAAALRRPPIDRSGRQESPFAFAQREPGCGFVRTLHMVS